MTIESSERDPLLKKTLVTVTDKSIEDDQDNQDNRIQGPAPGELQGWPLTLALTFPLLGILLVALDVTLTSTISATVASDFNSLSLVSWLGSSYLVAMTVVQSVSGSLTDRFGRRTGFLTGLIFFAVGNLVCGLATDATTLIVARVIAGAGGGAINSITTFVTSDLVSMRRRPFWQGLGNVAWAFGMGVGGIFGGVMNDLAGWRWAFMALTPLTLLVAFGAYLTFVRGLPRPVIIDGKRSQGVDYLGSAMLSGMLICLVLGLNLTEGGPEEDSSKHLTSTLIAAAGVFLVAFVVVEHWFASNPVIPLHLLGNRSVTSSCVGGFFLANSMHTLLFYVPVFMQVQGFSTSEVGLQLLGEPIGAAIGPFVVGLAIRELGSYSILKPISWIIYVSAPIIYYFSNLNTPVWVIFFGLVAMGAGFGSVCTVNLTGLLANVDQSYQAKSTSIAYVFRQTGASVGLALAGLIFRSQFMEEISHTNSFQTSGIADNISKQCDRHSFGEAGRPGVCIAYANALHSVFHFTLVAGVLGLFFGMLVRNRSLDKDPERKPVEGDDQA